MDEELRARYRALLDWIEPPDPYVSLVRPLVDATAERRGVSLRPDASYFLVVNFIEMIIRPYAGDLLMPPVWWRARGPAPGFLPPYRNYTPANTVEKIEQSLDVIMANIPEEREPDGVSAHQVMKAIDRSWATLSEYFGWG